MALLLVLRSALVTALCLRVSAAGRGASLKLTDAQPEDLWASEYERDYVLPPPLETRQVNERSLPGLGFGFWSVRGNQFVDHYGRVVKFSGVTWSGFETPDAIVHGLGGRSMNSHLDQMKSLGFNMIRLPFAGDTLKKDTYPSGISGANNDLMGLSSLQVMDQVIKRTWSRGMRVILDYHRLHLTTSNELGTWWDDSSPEELWILNWGMLARRYRNYANVIGADLFNEVHPNYAGDSFPGQFPDGAPYWVYNAGANEAYNFRRATVRVITYVHRVHPHWIFFLEGMWNNYWWGGNCAQLIRAPIVTPRNKIAYTTHEYGPYVYDGMKEFQASNFPRNLPGVFQSNWGFIQTRGIAPVWIGEFGSFYPEKDSTINRLESDTFESLIAYIRAIKASWTIFQWTPDSKDTGGVLSDDWNTPNEKKMKLLRTIMHYGFRP